MSAVAVEDEGEGLDSWPSLLNGPRTRPAEKQPDEGYDESHGYGPGHGGPTGPGDAPAKKEAPAVPPDDDDEDDDE